MKIYLHVGTHKTGTTSIQTTFHERRKALRKRGVWYLRSRNHTSFILPAYSSAPEKLRTNVMRHAGDPDTARARGARLRATLAAELRRARARGMRKFLISGEGMSLSLPAEDLARLKADLEPFADEGLRVIVYVRDPFGMVRSGIQETVKIGRPLERLLRKPPLPRYRARIEKFIDLFGAEAVEIREFAPRAFRDGDLLRDFWDALEETDPPEWLVSGARRMNESLSVQAMAVLDRLGRIEPLIRDGRRNPDRAVMAHLTAQEIAGDRFLLPPDLVDLIRDKSAPDIAWLTEAMGRPPFEERAPETAPFDPRMPDATLDALARHLNELALFRAERKRRDRRAGLGWAARMLARIFGGAPDVH